MDDVLAEAGIAATALAAAEEAQPLDARIDAWFAEHFHNTDLAQRTDLYNRVHAAVADLKRRLA